MFSVLKKKYVDVFCYTKNANAYEYFPIRQARDFIPDWWKNIPNKKYKDGAPYKTKGFLEPTMKRCPGLIEYYKKGLMLPLWSDVEIIVDENINDQGWSTAVADESLVEPHPDFQRGEFLPPSNWFHNKLNSPWLIETKEHLDFLYLQPHWNLNGLNNEVLIPNGYIDFYKGNHVSHIQMFINKFTNRVINIDAGTPILHLVPLTEKKIKVHTIYDEKKFNTLQEKSNGFSFTSKYYTKVKTLLRNRVVTHEN